jgi:hypothetical protein
MRLRLFVVGFVGTFGLLMVGLLLIQLATAPEPTFGFPEPVPFPLRLLAGG